jgi:hypothetical protein
METANDAAMEKFHFGIAIGFCANISEHMAKDYSGYRRKSISRWQFW